MEQPPSKETRVPVNLRIKFRSETIEQFVERYAVDVSRGGIFIRTREPLAVGTQLKFDFQLQDTSPLMAGEGTVVWIREHDPTRAGVTPGMGVRFDKLTPASQPVLDKILADKGKREPSGPNANTVSGKSGVAPLPRRPSSTFSAVDPAALGMPSSGGTQPGVGAPLPGGGVPGPTANPFAASSPSGLSTSPLARPTQPLSSLSSSPLGAPKPPAAAPGAGALPTLESQSALGRLATGPNLSAFGPIGAPRTKSPVPLAPKQATGDASGRVTASSVPTSVEDSERTQIADGLPEFATEQPTHVGGPALGLSEIAASRAPTITATSRRVPTPAPQPKLSLDDMAAPAASAGTESAAPTSRATSPDGGAGIGAASRTTSPDGSLSGDAAAAKRPSGSRPSVPHVGAHPAPGTLETDLASTVPASARISAVTPSVRTDTPFATPRVDHKQRPIATVIIIGALAGAALAAVFLYKLSNRAPEETAAPAQAENAAAPASAPTPAPAAAPAAPANSAAPEGPKTEPAAANPAAANAPTGEAKVGEAKGETAVAAEPKPGEAKAGEAKPAETKPAEPAAAEAKPAETKVAAADPAVKGGKKPRPAPHKKGAASAKGDEAAADSAGDDAANIARVISLPTGAEVLIDGQSVGKTPFQGKDIDPAAPHALTVRKDGFETYEHMVSASDWIKGKGPGQSLRVTVKLKKAAGGGGETKPAGDDKADKPEKAAPTEPAKTEPPPASETP